MLRGFPPVFLAECSEVLYFCLAFSAAFSRQPVVSLSGSAAAPMSLLLLV